MTVNLTFDIDEIDKAREVLDKLSGKKATKRRSFRVRFANSNYGTTDRCGDNDGFAPLYFEDSDDANLVISALIDNIKLYGYVTVQDLYDMIGCDKKAKYENTGWTDLSSAEVISDGDGTCVLNLPKPHCIIYI